MVVAVLRQIAQLAGGLDLAGDVDAQIRMGNRYLCGVTVEVDLDEASKWFLLAGKSGSAAGLMSLGLHYSGSAKPRDVAKAMHFYEKAAKLGHVW